MTIRTSNLDKTRTRIVRKGNTCDFFGLRFRVVRVRCGHVYGETLLQRSAVTFLCCNVAVVA